MLFATIKWNVNFNKRK